MFSIGEFARLGAVSSRTLRHYDEIGLLPPAGVDPVTGYRSYSAKQLRQLNRIVALLSQPGQGLADGARPVPPSPSIANRTTSHRRASRSVGVTADRPGGSRRAISSGA